MVNPPFPMIRRRAESPVQSRIAWHVALMSAVVACSPTLLLGGASDATLVLHVSAELRARHSDALRDAEFEVAGRTTRTLLATAGISVEVRDCRPARADCEVSAPGHVVISVRLRPERKTTDVTACGEVARDYLGRPVVVVYLPPHVDLATAFRFHVASRSNPALGEIRTGHLVGLTVAHEVGHWLGLPHAASGVMKARPALEEVTALASQRLAFESQQGSGLRQALLQRSLAVLADNR
jgi:hypothetical protein